MLTNFPNKMNVGAQVLHKVVYLQATNFYNNLLYGILDSKTLRLMGNGKPWTIGIVNPNAAGQVFSCMDVTNMAIATSGNYEKYIMVNGKKYSHTIDPRTGLPVTGIKSVTIITPNAEISDAMATPVMIMGIKAGINMVNQIKDMEAILIDDQDKIYTSDNIRFSLNAVL